ncbi:MAG: hypothetical protein J6M42_01855 [Clostridia bacterium]|nr:hypothetical protein [Clostridia bacterium]
MEDKLRSLFKMKFWSEFATFAILPLAAFLLLTVSLISRFDLIPLLHMGSSRELLVLALSVCLLLSGGVIGVKRFLLPYARDHRLLKNKEYRVIEGVVLRYDFRDDGGDPPTTVEIPIIWDRVTGEIMELDLGSHLIQNACYLIGYLPNTGIAVIDKRISYRI